jgi:DMSO reductase anchor subunit
MHPAFSVILLTTLIGAGQGLFLALFTVQTYALVGLLPPVAQPSSFYGWGSTLAMVLLAAGLFASFFHLGRPERAWRSAAQWRTSWLSREVIVLPAFMGAVALYGLLHAARWTPTLLTLPAGLPIDLSIAVGIVATVLAFALFICTGMVYACMRFLAEWHTPLTPLNYTLLGGASGFTVAAAYAANSAPELVGFLSAWAIVLTLAGAAGRVVSLWRNARLKPKSTVQTAIGIKHPRVVQTSRGFAGASFNTREFFHGKGAPLLRSVKWYFLVAAFALPALMLSIGPRSTDWLLAAFVVQFTGLLAERWFFFAQANHPQNLYYRAVS